jgi:Na+-translocating ferredoxin:NAD+ oxidoreductase subunit G
MGNIIKLSAILFFVAGIAAGMLAFYNSLTKPEIDKLKAQNEKEARQYVLKGLFPDEALATLIYDEEEFELDGKKEKFWKVRQTENDQVYKAFVFLSKGQGFSGIVETMVGTDTEFKINTIKVLKHTETPGLGAEAQAVKYGESKPFFETWFGGKNSMSVVVDKDNSASSEKVQSLTGATITTRTVCVSINKYAAAVKTRMDSLAKPQTVESEPSEIIEVDIEAMFKADAEKRALEGSSQEVK